ncbi:pilin [Patescibacteria group bacterium]|nr:pilin [Patescibacteria group bacterium]
MYYALAETGETPANPLTMNLLPDLQQAATGAQYGSATENTIPQIVGLIVRAVLSFVGAIFFILIIFSGIQWMTAGGNEEKITKARARMTNAAIGLAITTAAYFITWFISEALLSNV